MSPIADSARRLGRPLRLLAGVWLTAGLMMAAVLLAASVGTPDLAPLAVAALDWPEPAVAPVGTPTRTPALRHPAVPLSHVPAAAGVFTPREGAAP